MTNYDMTCLVNSKVHNVVKNSNTFFKKKTPIFRCWLKHLSKKNYRSDYAFLAAYVT